MPLPVQGFSTQPLNQYVLANAVDTGVEVGKRLADLKQNLEIEYAAKTAVEVEKRVSEVRKVLNAECAAKKEEEENLYHRRAERYTLDITLSLYTTFCVLSPTNR